MKLGQPGESTPKPNFHGAKVILYYELLKSDQTITYNLYQTQVIRLNRALAEKRPEYAARHETVIFHHDNDWPHVAILVQKYLE